MVRINRDFPVYALAILALGGSSALVVWKVWTRFNNFALLDALAVSGGANHTHHHVCQLNFCHADPAEDKRMFSKYWLLAVYCLVAFMGLLYLTFENGPCHRCRSLEGGYKTVAILLIWASSRAFEISGGAGLVTSGAIEVRQVYRSILFIHLCRTFADIDHPIRGFFANAGARQAVKHKTIRDHGLPPRGVRVTAELNDLVFSVVGDQTDMSSRNLAMVLLGFFMLEELGLAFPKFDTILQVCAELSSLGCILYSTYWALWVLRRRRLAIRRIQELVEHLVSSGNRSGAWRESVAGLRYMLMNVSVGTLIELGGVRVRDALMQAIEKGMLDTATKATIADACQKIGLRGEQEEQELHDIFKSCEGEELTLLKTLIDGSGGYYNLYKLIFEDFKSDDLREEILQHVAREAEAVRAEMCGNAGIKVLSDVDDTLLSSGGHFPSGCDASYPKGVVYPGCLKFYQCLETASTDEPSCNLIFLSARPHVYKDVAEQKSYEMFIRLVDEGRMHSLPTLLPGRLKSGMKAMFLHRFQGLRAWRSVGEDKHDTFSKFAQLYPEYDFVFLGDDGQGDLLAGQMMLTGSATYNLRAVVIHKVAVDCKPLSLEYTLADDSSEEDCSDQELQPRICFHKTYVGAAVNLHLSDPKLLTLEKVAEIAKAAIDDFEMVRLTYVEWYSSPQGEASEQDLRMDLTCAEALVGPGVLPALLTREEVDSGGSLFGSVIATRTTDRG